MVAKDVCQARCIAPQGQIPTVGNARIVATVSVSHAVSFPGRARPDSRYHSDGSILSRRPVDFIFRRQESVQLLERDISAIGYCAEERATVLSAHDR